MSDVWEEAQSLRLKFVIRIIDRKVAGFTLTGLRHLESNLEMGVWVLSRQRGSSQAYPCIMFVHSARQSSDTSMRLELKIAFQTGP